MGSSRRMTTPCRRPEIRKSGSKELVRAATAEGGSTLPADPGAPRTPDQNMAARSRPVKCGARGSRRAGTLARTMAAQGFALFDTAIGVCSIAWREGGVVGVLLPEGTAVAMRAKIAQRFPDAREEA